MKTPYDDLRTVFEKAHELREQIEDGDTHGLAQLNGMVDARKLGGRLVVLSIPDYDLQPACAVMDHSGAYPSGTLGSFALRNRDDDHEPELVIALDDVRNIEGGLKLVPVTGDVEPFDVVAEQSDSGLLREVLAFCRSSDFTFELFASLCSRMDKDNLSLALFASALNRIRLPATIASGVYTTADSALFYVNDRYIKGSRGMMVRYPIDRMDMFDFIQIKTSLVFQTRITNILPSAQHLPHRSIIVDGDMQGFDLA